ncbi:hypothetical protein D8M34_06010 [Microbacterium sp. HSID17254]|uniref:hypothetical protein n=1 Tax=Microbacterium sp. HSID17254 TaxID=2419509 RepID=UPI000F8646DD|nr:hypothetical protein [Microbacterium sp. HSID17254]RUQ07023.1 hypothetical protein D8M34_06010 [Microbacterium sp. HSID17254]
MPDPTVTLREQHQEHLSIESTQAWAAGDPDATPGDCWRACLASLLEVPIAVVPHFVALYPDTEDELTATHGPPWWRESVAWVGEVRPGWAIGAWDVPSPWKPVYLPGAEAPDRVILTGRSPRGDWLHSVLVWDANGTLAHDPFPGGEGVNPPYSDRIALVPIQGVGHA